MIKLDVKIPPKEECQYPIIIGDGLLPNAFEYINQNTNASKFLIVTNQTVYGLWANKLNIPSSTFLVLPDGEEYKNFENLQTIISKALSLKLERKDAFVALGGGVIGDITGFAASIYQRGVDFIQIPTTLLAQVDSSVGGKVAINLDEGKNLIGSFYQPKLVLTDITTLSTLDERQFKTGLAEVLKYAFIEKSCIAEKDYNFFKFLEKNIEKIFSQDKNTMSDLINTCCILKSAVVAQDEKEKGLRAILNFGHTFAHAIEKITKYKFYTHGEAVALGMKMAFDLSYELILISKEDYEKSINLLNAFGLTSEISSDLTSDNIFEAMLLDKKVTDNKIRLVLPTSFNTVKVFDDITEKLIKKVVLQRL